jgi:hypothetical protein
VSNLLYEKVTEQLLDTEKQYDEARTRLLAIDEERKHLATHILRLEGAITFARSLGAKGKLVEEPEASNA